MSLLGGYRAVLDQGHSAHLGGCRIGDGTLIMTAADSGCAAIGLETRAAAVIPVQGLGFNTLQHDFVALRFEVAPDVLSMMDVLEQIPYPREALTRRRKCCVRVEYWS